jgi:hypothetical protein
MQHSNNTICTEQFLPLNTLKAGTFFKRKADAKKVFTRAHYNACDKTYTCGNYENSSDEIFLKGKTLVFVGFTY